jgi:PAS domain S-box-containing protein
LDRRRTSRAAGEGPALGQIRQDLKQRLDDLRGFGVLITGGADHALDGEEALMGLSLSLIDALESTQRRVIETSIQILSLRELVAKLLSLHTAAEVAETVTMYLSKAFDHERVLVGITDEDTQALAGWTAVRDGETRLTPFRLDGEWGGALRDVMEREEPVRGRDARTVPLVAGDAVSGALDDFGSGNLGPFMAYPLRGRGPKADRALGVLMVGRNVGGTLGDLDASILEGVVDAVGTATENLLLEEDVRREEAFRKDVMGSMASGLVAVDLEGRVLAMNAAAQDLTGRPFESLRGGALTALDPPGGGVAALLAKTLAARQPILRVERPVVRADGSAFPAACATSLLRDPSGTAYGAIVTMSDITEIKVMEQRIRSLDRLAALGRFTAGIAHEIRNPLTGIGTGVQYLERHLRDDAGQTENLTFIRNEILRLNRIVEDLFRVTHPHPLRKSPEDPKGLLERAVMGLGDLPETRKVTIHLRIDPALEAVTVDPDQMQQVLLNLLKNAVEAAPEGGTVEVHAYASGDEPRPHTVIQVVDSGPGIDPESLPKIFEPFFTKGKASGTGLGLYVSHGIVERHGGELHAANHNQGGAVLTVRLPLDTYELTEML